MKRKSNIESRPEGLAVSHAAKRSAELLRRTGGSVEDLNFQSLPKDKRFKDMTGMRFGRLLVLGLAERSPAGNKSWYCQCDCGSITRSPAGALRSGKTLSCSCLNKDILREGKTTHGMSKTPTHNSWCRMMYRCYCKTGDKYALYGARGITVCDRWRFGEDGKSGFECFYSDMGERPMGKTVHRVDNDGNYEPSNCVWATQKEQMLSTSKSHRLTLNGISLTVSQWTERLGFKNSTIQNRLRRGWTEERILTTPIIPPQISGASGFAKRFNKSVN